MKTQKRNLRGMISPNAKITCLHDYPPNVWMAMAEDFSARDCDIQIKAKEDVERPINIRGICYYLSHICEINGINKDFISYSYDLVIIESGSERPFDDNDERVLFCLMMYWATKNK